MQKTPLWKRISLQNHKNNKHKDNYFNNLNLPIQCQVTSNLNKQQTQAKNFQTNEINNKSDNCKQKVRNIQCKSEIVGNSKKGQKMKFQYKNVNSYEIMQNGKKKDNRKQHNNLTNINKQSQKNVNIIQDIKHKQVQKLNDNKQTTNQQLIMKAHNIKINQLKNILKELFDYLRKYCQNLKMSIYKQLSIISKYLYTYLPEAFDYIQLQKLLQNKQNFINGINNEVKLQKDQTIQSLQQIEKINHYEYSLLDEYKKLFYEKNGDIQLLEYQNKQLIKKIEQGKIQIKKLKSKEQLKENRIRALEDIINKYNNQKLILQKIQRQYIQQNRLNLQNLKNQLEQKFSYSFEKLENRYKKQLLTKQNQIQKIQKSFVEQLQLKNAQIQNLRKYQKVDISNLKLKIQTLSKLHKRRVNELTQNIKKMQQENEESLKNIKYCQQKMKKMSQDYEAQIKKIKEQNYITLQENFTLLQRLDSSQYQNQQKVSKIKAKLSKQFKQKIHQLQSQNSRLKRQLFKPKRQNFTNNINSHQLSLLFKIQSQANLNHFRSTQFPSNHLIQSEFIHSSQFRNNNADQELESHSVIQTDLGCPKSQRNKKPDPLYVYGQHSQQIKSILDLQAKKLKQKLKEKMNRKEKILSENQKSRSTQILYTELEQGYINRINSKKQRFLWSKDQNINYKHRIRNLI